MKKSLIKTYFLIQTNFVIMTSITLFRCCEKFNETSLPEKNFYSRLNMGDITYVNYTHGKSL